MSNLFFHITLTKKFLFFHFFLTRQIKAENSVMCMMMMIAKDSFIQKFSFPSSSILVVTLSSNFRLIFILLGIFFTSTHSAFQGESSSPCGAWEPHFGCF